MSVIQKWCVAACLLVNVAMSTSVKAEVSGDVKRVQPTPVNEPKAIQTSVAKPASQAVSTNTGEPTPSVAQMEISPKLIIIIDDLGNNRQQMEAATQLPTGVTFAVLPHTPFAPHIGKLARASGRELMLHLPMANHSGNALGEGGLVADMPVEQRQATFQAALASLPQVKGVNNHMGSLLTEDTDTMAWLMAELKSRDLYFVDSLTSAKSVAWKQAQAKQLPFLKRHIFLDHEITTEFIDQQFTKGLTIAKSRGYAVLIGHPYPETLAYLSEALPKLIAEQSVELLPASALSDLAERQALLARYQQRFTQLAQAKQASLN